MLIRLQVLIVHTSVRHTTCQQSPSYSAYFDGGALPPRITQLSAFDLL
jgi:hypothetical protein